MDYDSHLITKNEHSKNDETQESFRQNFSFAEKILDVQGMFPTLSDDHDIRKITREKVENMLYAQQLIPETEIQHIEGYAYLGAKGINQWIWDNRVQPEISQSLLREYLSRGMHNTPYIFFKKFQLTRNLLLHIAKLYGIEPSQIQDRHLLDPKSLHQVFENLPKDKTPSLFHFLMRKSNQNGTLDKDFPFFKASNKQQNMHPRILSFQMDMEEKGLSHKHIRNTATHVKQLFVWLCANVEMFKRTTPDTISVFQIQNEHLLMYRTYKLRLVSDGVNTQISFAHSIYSIRSFYHFLHRRFGYQPPLQRFRSVKAPRYSPRELPTDQQIEAFFYVVAQYARNPVREEIGYRLMFHLGLRLSEVAQIKWSDVNLGTRTIVIHSKGKKSHILPLVGKLYSLLRELHTQPSTTYLMGQKISTIKHELYEYFNLYTMITGWLFPGGVHIFRHIFITRLAFKGVLPQAIKELARVRLLDTVGLYMHMAHRDQHMISQIDLLKYE
ncbi:tyrosine-type recombinase/integrase [Paenibacillus sp. FSL H7-0323]|uniref:tyrosine-type recombinase/integrase n=1 Tax=Paenibacillus sp. FSL H7-0323 TaxID=2921433 RepID=UPI0030F91CD9